MTLLVRLYLRTAIAFLILGVLTGLHMSSARHLGAGGFHGPYIVAHAHVILIGFMLMLVMGVCLWKLPEPAAPARWAWLDPSVYTLLTVTTAARFTLEVVSGYRVSETTSVAIFVVSTLQTVAIVTFFVRLLPRIRSTAS